MCKHSTAKNKGQINSKCCNPWITRPQWYTEVSDLSSFRKYTDCNLQHKWIYIVYDYNCTVQVLTFTWLPRYKSRTSNGYTGILALAEVRHEKQTELKLGRTQTYERTKPDPNSVNVFSIFETSSVHRSSSSIQFSNSYWLHFTAKNNFFLYFVNFVKILILFSIYNGKTIRIIQRQK